MLKNKVRGHVTLAEDTKAPKSVSEMGPGHRFHLQITLLPGNVYGTGSLPTFEKEKILILIAYVGAIKCRINFNIILTLLHPLSESVLLKTAWPTYFHSSQRLANRKCYAGLCKEPRVSLEAWRGIVSCHLYKG